MDDIRQNAIVLLRRALADPTAEFRDGQWEAIESLYRQQARLLVVQRTGWGKSVVYFVATRLLRDTGRGPTLLISPLLALMRNQIAAAERLGLNASTVNSSNRKEWVAVEAQVRAGIVDLLLVSPERLGNDDFRDRVLSSIANDTGLLVVDEAHCISDWGHDFRPDYRRIVRVIQALPRNLPVLATTATANDRVVDDVRAQLGVELQVIRGPLARSSLRLQAIALASPAARLAWLAERLPLLEGSGIIYTLTIRDAERVAAWLRSQGIDAQDYSGSKPPPWREELEQRLLDNRIKVLVATSALGMGFDKPDLTFVIHYQRPSSVIHYYQQVGRAGRALDAAYGILLCGSEDDEIADYFIHTAFPPEAHVAAVLMALEGASDGLTPSELERGVNLGKTQIERVLKSLSVKSPAPITREGSRWYLTAAPYIPDLDKIERITGIRYEEQARMRAYVQGDNCLMQFLQRELDDPAPLPCGRCAVCLGRPLLSEGFAPQMAEQALRFLRGLEIIIEPRTQWPLGAFAGWHGSIAATLQAEPGRALSVWGDNGLGQQVREGKQYAGRFDDPLVAATVALVRDRWRPRPSPQWITCVPSLNHPDLVPDFTRRVAGRLGLPFIPCVRKVRATEPQKGRQNSFQQARNLDSAFRVATELVRPGPVLLIDDMVDSGWTFTVVAALLRQEKSGPVFPLALSNSAGGT